MTSSSGSARPAAGQRLERRSAEHLRADEHRLGALLPAGVQAVHPPELAARARRYLAARDSLERRRAAVGERPFFLPAAEGAVLAAKSDVATASAGRREAAAASHRLLALGNLCGLAMIGACIAAVLAGASPLSVPVGVGIMSSAGGPIGALIGGWRGRIAARQVHAEAVAEWCAALERAGVETMGELWAAHVRHDAWRMQCRELEAAADAEAVARQHWVEVAGEDLDPAAIGALAAALRQLRSIRLGLLEHALHELAASRQALIDLRTAEAELREGDERAPTSPPHAPVVPATARRRSGNHPAVTGVDLRRLRVVPDGEANEDLANPPIDGSAVEAGVNEGAETRDEMGDEAGAEARDDGGSRVLDLLERVKDKGLHLWVKS